MLTPVPQPIPAFVQRAAIRKLNRNGWVIDRSVDQMLSGKDLMDFSLYRIQEPTLLIWGSQDRLIPLAVAESMHRQMPGSNLLIIEGCGHLAPQECSRPVLRGTIRFLRAATPPRDTTASVKPRH